MVQVLGLKVLTPVFDGADDISMENGFARASTGRGRFELALDRPSLELELEIAEKS